MTKIVGWFSNGIASAVACKLLLTERAADEIVIARCVLDNEHQDNWRFKSDCETWFGREIVDLRSDEFLDCFDVWETRRYIAGIKGAPCTTEMKKVVRWAFEREWHPDEQAFGYTVEERKRAANFRANNPDVRLLTPLIEAGFTKTRCAEIVAGAGIELPVMYRLGFSNNNCIGCAKATSIVYWARVRRHFPFEFERMAELSRRLGARLTRLEGKRIFLDEIPLDIDWRKKDRENVECGVLCIGEGQ